MAPLRAGDGVFSKAAAGRHAPVAAILGGLLLAALVGAPAPAAAQGPPAAPGQSTLSPDQARRALAILQDDRRRQDLLDTLAAVARAAPAADPAATPETDGPAAVTPPAAAAPPAAAPPAAPPAAPAAAEEPVGLAEDGLLARLILAASAWFTAASGQLARAGNTMADLPSVWDWLVRTATGEASQARVLHVAWKLAVVLALAWAAQYLVRRAVRPWLAAAARMAREKVERRARKRQAAAAAGEAANTIASRAELRFLRRLPMALLRLALELAPVLTFAAVGNLLQATPLTHGWTVSLVVVAAVNAYVVQHAIMAMVRALVSPDNDALRPFRLQDETAAYIEIWAARLTSVMIYGVAVLEIARALGLGWPAYRAVLKLVVLLSHALMAVVVLQCRQGVARWIAAPPGGRGAFALARDWLAAIWHVLAIFLLVALWFVWAAEIKDGYTLLLRYFGATVLVVVLARLILVAILGVLDRMFRIDAERRLRLPFLEERANRYYPLMRRAVSAAMVAVTLLAILQIWGVGALDWFRSGGLGSLLTGFIVTVATAIAVALLAWEVANAWMDRHIRQMVEKGDYARSARLRTLLPLLRTALLLLILVVVGFTALSQIGVNIAPLLAGASILGVAIGFGSQKLVQDVITGMFLLLENTMQVGDWVTVSGLSGSVEALSVRTIRLRAGDGSVHVIPFSSVTTVTNTNRGIGNAAVSVAVDAAEDTDRVGRVLQEIGAELRGDADFRNQILGDFELWGVDKVEGASTTIVGQMRCRDTGRWGVQREFNRRMKRRFQDLGIRMAVPAQAVTLAHAPPPPAPRREPAGEPPASGAKHESPPPAALSNTA